MVNKMNKKTSWNKGLKMTEEHKRNHKKAMQKFCGENNVAKRPEVKKKISIAKNRGKKTPLLVRQKQSKKRKELLENGLIPGNFIHGKTRKRKNKKPYSHFVWCSQQENHPHVPKGFVIHHMDLNPHNNKPDNLTIMDKGYHTGMHRKIFKLNKEVTKIGF